MQDLQKLSVQILEKIKEEGNKKLNVNEDEMRRKLDEHEQKLVESKQERQSVIASQVAGEYEREAQTLANRQRNAILAKKQSMLNTVFDEATKQLAAWDYEKFSYFLKGVLSQLDQHSSWLIVPGELSDQLFQHDQVKKILMQYPSVTLSENLIKHKAGFIVQQAGIDYNFCFDVLVKELKKEFSPQLATLAFKNNE
ncbi:V/A-type H+-transporting ATPase subunit E [Amphibacillus marinus]|uniref:V/A-type H+-transporting ATPase subunit E n=1 Tax=Amphibacillus marinus TaxID=872970 RepID=A0A1H8GT20_9BACI|nr:hypothetical protein [Amphibacillus marinus]SEN46854.1 V/A-type H+-transporting ATPase subunit E [Amphibacillus marinus]